LRPSLRPPLAYTLALTVAAVATLVWAIRDITGLEKIWLDILILGILTWATTTFRALAASVSGVVAVASYPIVGLYGAVIVAAFALLAWRRSFPFVKRLYNASQQVLDTLAGGLVFSIVVDPDPVKPLPRGVELFELALGSVAAYATLLVVNAALLSIVVRLDQGVSPGQVLQTILAPTILPILGYGLLGLLLAVLWIGGLDWASAPFMLLPLFVARWAFAQYEAEQASHEAAIHALAKMVEIKDLYTRGHSERVSQGVLKLGRVLELDAPRLQALGYAGLLHDVGKVGVPLSVLRKSGPLTDGEMDEIKLHPTRGVQLVGDIDFLGEAHRGIQHHHERLDGSGYPDGLAGNAIPEFARIIAVADAFDSMTTSRSYRGARSIDEAVAELQRCRDTHFDAGMVDAFVAALRLYGWDPVTPEFAAALAGAPVTIDHDDLSRLGSVPETAATDPAALAMVAASVRTEPTP